VLQPHLHISFICPFQRPKSVKSFGSIFFVSNTGSLGCECMVSRGKG
jgi:hypothetical protein